MRDNLTGPALGGVLARWNDYPIEDLYSWIRNSQKMIEQKHPKALQIWKEWKPIPMQSFEQLTDEEITAILDYIDYSYMP